MAPEQNGNATRRLRGSRGRSRCFPQLRACALRRRSAPAKRNVRQLKQRVAIEAPALQSCAELLDRFRLNLSHAFAGDVELTREILERGDVAAIETVTTLDHHALAIVQLRKPDPHPRFDLRVVQQKLR